MTGKPSAQSAQDASRAPDYVPSEDTYEVLRVLVHGR